MGLTPLHQAVCQIVEPLRTKERRDDYLQMHHKIQDEFERADTLRNELKEAGGNA